VAELPRDLPAAVAVVLHLSPTSKSLLAQILSRVGPLPAQQAVDGDHLEDGHIYVAAPDHHLLVEGHRLRVSRGATENGVRPAVDPLLRTAAASFGPRTIGVVLSGSLDDGTAGLFEVKRRGGWTMVQDPKDALYPAMPLSAIQHVDIDVVADCKGLAEFIAAAAHGKLPRHPLEPANEPDDDHMRPSGMSCPDCSGQLWEIHSCDQVRYRCRTGHEWTALALVEGQERVLENALWAALRIVRERTQLTHNMLERAVANNEDHVEQLLVTRLAELHEQDDRLRDALDQPVSALGQPDPALEHWTA
jgi:two-component system chemotaxis response regulator CheB